MRILNLMALVLCGCATPQAPDSGSPQLAAHVGIQHSYSPTCSERSRAEAIARAFAMQTLGVSHDRVSRMRIHRSGGREVSGNCLLYLQFYDPDVFQPMPSGGFVPVMGGFPDYFTVTVDVQSQTVVDHYASDR